MTDQPMPTPGRLNVTDIARGAFLELLKQREQKGIAEYGVSLQTWNGRDAFQDTLEELTDAFQYVMQAMLETKDLRATLEAEQHINRQLARNVLEAQAERDRYKRALEWYANEALYDPPHREAACPAEEDNGKVARAALAAAGSETGEQS